MPVINIDPVKAAKIREAREKPSEAEALRAELDAVKAVLIERGMATAERFKSL
jgi:hypothetical protein